MPEEPFGETAPLGAFLYDGVPVGVLVEDTSRNLLAVNHRLCELFQVPSSPESLIGRDATAFAQEISSSIIDDAGFLEHITAPTQKFEALDSLEWELVDGRTVTQTYLPIRVPQGEGHLWVFHEGTDLSPRLAALYENSPDMIDILDSQGTLLDVNTRFCEELGYSEDEVIGRPIWEFDQQVDAVDVLDLLDSFAEDERRKFDGVYERQDGTTLPVEVHLLRLDLDGEDRFLAISRDITERKAYEVGLKALHDTAQEMLRAKSKHAVADIITDAVANILEMPLNGVFFYSQTKNQLEPAVVTNPGRQLINQPPTFEPGTSLAWEVFEAGESRRYDDVTGESGRYNLETVFRSELIVPLGDHGIVLIGSLEQNAFDDQDQSLVETLASHAEAVLDRLDREKELETKNRRLDEFASVISHDLRNPLNVATGRLELAREKNDSEDLEVVARALERSQALIEDLRTLTQTGDSITTTDSIELATLCEQSWQTIDTGESKLNCESDLRFDGDPGRVRQLLENLFRNAVVHGGDAVTVTVGDLDDGFYIEDDGAGIPAEEREHVFDAGYTTEPEGTGMGLNIVAQIVAAHDWEIRISDSPSGGTRFEIANVSRHS